MSTKNPEIAIVPEADIPDRQTLEWHAGDMPYSQEFGDHFYCREDGRLECGHVFLAGNGLPGRWRGPGTFRIGELGFGTGLNCCETWRQWKTAAAEGTNLHFVSFERFPMQAGDIGRALSHWPEIDAERQALCAAWPDAPNGRIDLDLATDVRLTVVCGPAFDTIPGFPAPFDAWYLDGFAPRRNPDMWSQELMRVVQEKTVEEGTFATYAAAGFVRRNLQAAGFIVERRPGFGSKREMLCGVKSTSGVAE
ncbi:tRNA (5-methylaminomethyl-2-thiouridine)(34)-methyltransferase MnmD [Rhizobium sp. LjRoot98]|uniref:tRNA (5-methylaminomethyl-2-thiouridine)(34)-methyltransferase MnmD n=1 Tax=unclassified Rhizobium TaxID=2613769 RepID=UPI0007137280|nr:MULTISPECIES: tRNA (5-methylaminomethyl-2-thiouridine)(34)-methyltransferase MnmD [unclassified Rhizobium]KQV29887.1 5-methylaminomethyl-2-thiouridine methyltransferase [Rhizobium sp. Root1204]KQY04979.1 5-methylaminomethyl-2-thiouridine methyltransferase [Rhizobium sp. Root1334]KRC01625.1 5-methylaminomethyl-2-thiouridine methyltransferase [Rhizobium sp. Root73]